MAERPAPGKRIVLRLTLIAVGIAGVLATTAAAQVGGSSARPSEAPEPMSNPTTTADSRNDDPDKVICRSVRPPTGTRVKSSRTRTKVCMTKGEWEQQEREAQELIKERDRGTCPLGGSCRG